MRGHEPEDRQDETRLAALDANRHLTLVAPGKPGAVGARDLHPDVRPGVARPYEEHAARLQLGWIAIRAGVHLHDARVELGGEVGHCGRPVEPRRDYDVVALEAVIAAADDVAVAVLAQPIHLHPHSHRKLEARGGGLEAVGGLAR